MKLNTLFLEPSYIRTLDLLTQSIIENGHTYVSPTPIISPFWNTTFTPSSSEVIFRGFESNPPTDSKIYTVQPCIRINDLQQISHGWHLLFFHMVSSFVLQVENYEDTLVKSLQAVVKASGFDLSDFYFTVSTNAYLPNVSYGEGLGDSLLQKIGISEKNIIFNSGSDNYQNYRPYKTADKKSVWMTGPKIEIYIRPSSSESLYEVATCLLGTTCQDKAILGNAFAFAVGLERLSAITECKTNINDMQCHALLVEQLSSSLLHTSMAKTLIGRQAIAEILLLIDALTVVSSIVSMEKQTSAVMNHYRRIVRELSRTLQSMGINLDNLFMVLTEELGKDIEVLLDSKFLRSQIEEVYSDI